MNQLQALIFDVDGTLANTERDGHRLGFNQAFAQMGLDWQWSVELYGELLAVAGGKERIKYFIDRYQPNLPKVENLTEFIKQLHQLKNKHYQALLKKGAIPLRPGVKRLITEAREQGLRLAIATTTTLANATTLLENALDPAWFEVIAAGDIVPAKKPAPDIYFYVLAQMQIEPEHCLVFEDTAHGLEAATKAKLKTVVTVNNYTDQQDFSKAALVVNHLGEADLPTKIIQGQEFSSKYLSKSKHINLASLRDLVANI